MSKKLDGKDIWVRKFEVTDPRKHKKGFTVYKVISTVFPRNFPDGATRIIVWKRYKEFKILHKELDALFHQLYLTGKFPPLPKDKFFGRFDDDVIESRRTAALELLEFAATYPQLFMNKVFVKFFEDGHFPRDFLDETGLCVDDSHLSVKVEEENRNFEDCLVPEKAWQEKEVSPEEDGQDSSPSFSGASPEPSSTTLPEGLESDVVSLPADPVDIVPLSIAATSAINVVGSGAENEYASNNIIPKPQVVTFSDASSSHCNNQSNGEVTVPSKQTISSISIPAPYSLQDTKNLPYMGSSASLNEDLDYLDEEFDFCRNESNHVVNSASTLSLNACDGVERPSQLSTSSSLSLTTKRNYRKYSGFNLFDFLPIFTKKQDKVTEEQNLSNSLSSYVREAAGFISVARRHESVSDYAAALDSYTEGIRILLEGAQADEDNQRRTLVKRKVEKYLSHAEELKRKVKGPVEAHLRVPHPSGGDVGSGSTTSEDSFVVFTSNVMPSSIEELKNYKVVGSTYNNILVAVDLVAHGGPNCFAIKVLRKSPSLLDPEKPSLIPSSIPFMVQLVKWFNTDDAVVLVLQYAAGGRLWKYVQSYQTKDLSKPETLDSPEPMEANKPKTSICDIEPTQIFIGKDHAVNNPIEIKLPTTLNVGSADFFDIPFADEIAHKLENVVVNGQDPTVKNGLSLQADPEPSKAASSEDLHTNALIENSRALLNTVSKTLEIQKKATTQTIPSSTANFHSSLEVQLPEKEVEKFKLYDSVKPSPFMGFNSAAPPEVDDSQINGEGTIPTRTIPERCIKIWAAELVIGLNRLHSQGITFGDLDINNILLGENGHILFSYRALWNEVDSKSEWNDFSAPEVANYALGKALWKSHPSCDWWSLGAILYFLLTGLKLQSVHPEGLHPQTVICVPPYNLLGELISTEARTFLVELLHFTPTLRLGYYGAEEIKSHPFFAEIDWAAAESSTLAGDCK